MIDEKKARRVIDFIQCLKHTKGEFHGKPFKLLPWQEKIIRDVFGTVREDDPTMRQYTTAYIEIPKKQGKALALSTLLPTPQGWKQMGDIRVGDQVFDEAGRPCNCLLYTSVKLPPCCMLWCIWKRCGSRDAPDLRAFRPVPKAIVRRACPVRCAQAGRFGSPSG